MPPILSTSHCEFNGARSCAHARKPSLYHQSTRLVNKYYLCCIYNRLLEARADRFHRFFTWVFMRASFFSYSFLSFSSHTFLWACGSLHEPRKFSLFVHSLVCPLTHSSLDEFQPNLVQHFPQVCSTCHTIFSLKKTLECVYERLLHCRLISAITCTPSK